MYCSVVNMFYLLCEIVIFVSVISTDANLLLNNIPLDARYTRLLKLNSFLIVVNTIDVNGIGIYFVFVSYLGFL
jgi:hypothetical protein